MGIRLTAPAFWWQPPGLASRALAPLAALYGAVAARRMQRDGAAAPAPVVCIGNLVAGGQGKTPAAIALARHVSGMGLNPVLLTRGFGGRLAGPVLVDRGTMTASDAGDEALLLAEAAPTVIARRRRDAAASGLLDGYGLVIMDDGFQSPSLHKACSVIIADGARGIGNGCVLPAGPLRAPLALQLARTSLLVVVRDAERGISGSGALLQAAQHAGTPVAFASLAARACPQLDNKPLLAFAGIGRPEKFFASLRASGHAVARTAGFPDHHRYSEQDAAGLLAAARANGLTLVTTSKDHARLGGAPGGSARAGLHAAAGVFAVDLVPDEASVMGRIAEMALASARLA